MNPPDSSGVLPAVARLVTEATSLRDVVSRLASVLREVIPFERMHLLRLDRAESVTLYTTAASGAVEVIGHDIPDQAAGKTTLEQTTAIDSSAASVMICPLRGGARVHGALWFTSEHPKAFAADHQTLVDQVADLVALAVQHDAIRTTEAVRRERLDSLERLLYTVTGALDIRRVFQEVSDVVGAVLPHDVLALTSWADRGQSFSVYAVAGATVEDPALLEPISLPQAEQALLNPEAYVIRDVTVEIDPQSTRGRIFGTLGVMSALRVAIPLGNAVFGSLFFLSREPESFTNEDIDFGRQVANHLAVALSHERLAEASRRDAAARDQAARLEAQVATLTQELEQRGGHARVIGSSPPWKSVLAQAARVARTETTVLLTGESGTGKEVVARFIHQGSRRSRGPFIAINCAALPDQLLESELFGHERGAFTGAVGVKPGRIEQANGGVLFLDEIGEMSIAVQAKLLRFLEQREFLRLGGTRLLHADIRVIAATNRAIGVAIQQGDFREDLYYRLGVFEIALPPLRDRPEDILELADAFLEEIGRSVGRPAASIARAARQQLLAYHWPGNVRELRNAIERAVILADGAVIDGEFLPFARPRPDESAANSMGAFPAGGVNLNAIERSFVEKALTHARFNKTRAAKLLGLTRAQLYSRIQKYGLEDTESS